jgi:hypothetical protein
MNQDRLEYCSSWKVDLKSWRNVERRSNLVAAAIGG